MECEKMQLLCDSERKKRAEGRDECGIRVQDDSVSSKPTASSLSRENRERKMYQTAEFPIFKLKSRRLLTFEDWPVGLRQKPEDLAEAGFFYTGHGDRTKCFHCGGGLKDWEEDDDPWQQHVQWFSQCAYIKFKLAKSFM